jgi:DNA polymerase III epsilon subunit-like protein
VGQFGWELTKDDDALGFARIVQIGWAVSPADMSSPVVVKRVLVKPSSFTIQDRATDLHKITHAFATQHGTPLAEALGAFLTDVEEEYNRGGRLCAHQIEFDAGIILCELRRCGLDELATTWQRMAARGFCTMSSALGRWVLMNAGEQVQEDETARHFLGLKTISRTLKIPDCESLVAQHHDAGTDAKLTCLVCASVLQRAAAGQQGKQ